MTATVAPAQVNPFRLPSYRRYLAGTTVFSMGNGAQFIAASWLTLKLGGGAESVAMTLVWTTVPGILLSPFIGVIIDRVNRRRLATLVSVLRAVALCLIPAVAATGTVALWHVYLTAALVGLADRVYRPATQALLAEVVPVAGLLRANSAASVGTQVGAAAGAAVAGLLITVIAPADVILVNAAGSALSAACVGAMSGGGAHRTDRGRRRYVDDVRDGWRYIVDHPNIIVINMTALSLLTTLRTINVLLAPFVDRVLHAGSQGFGLIDSSYAVGAIVGASLLPVVVGRVGRPTVMLGSLALLAAALTAFSFAGNVPTAMVCYALIGLGFATYGLFVTMTQEQVALDYQGRVQSLFQVLFGIVSLAVYMATGKLAEVYGERVLYLSQAVIMLATATYAYAMMHHLTLVARRED
ncbi:MFS transporter [Micromonospora tulbaghiae]|uniref:MFS transporter n=1 Tax=Micromonospora tulbaghiae TaxID=479978 RepID=UPI0036A6DE22